MASIVLGLLRTQSGIVNFFPILVTVPCIVLFFRRITIFIFFLNYFFSFSILCHRECDVRNFHPWFQESEGEGWRQREKERGGRERVR